MRLNILVGNIGSGKSLLARKLAIRDGALVVNMDAIQQMIGGGDYGRYNAAIKGVYRAAEMATIEAALRAGRDVVVDRTNLDRARRARYIALAREYTMDIVAYDFGCGDQVCINRRIKDPRDVPVERWQKAYEVLKRSYEKPSEEEGFAKIIVPPSDYLCFAFDFDGTIVENKFPSIGNLIDSNVDHLELLYGNLSNIVIIWTCRSGDALNEMRQFLHDAAIPYDFINENPLFYTGSPKVFAHEYYDDRSLIGALR